MQSANLQSEQSEAEVRPDYLAEFPESFRDRVFTFDPRKMVTQGGEIPTSDLLVKECSANRRCLQCGKQLPLSATKPRKFCDNNDKCRKAYEYEKNVPKRDAAKLEKLILDTEFEVKWSAWAGTGQGQQVLAEREEERIRKENQAFCEKRADEYRKSGSKTGLAGLYRKTPSAEAMWEVWTKEDSPFKWLKCSPHTGPLKDYVPPAPKIKHVQHTVDMLDRPEAKEPTPLRVPQSRGNGMGGLKPNRNRVTTPLVRPELNKPKTNWCADCGEYVTQSHKHQVA
jgi:hypothetical protein